MQPAPFALFLMLTMSGMNLTADGPEGHRRSFDELGPIEMDFDGDGLPDTFIPRKTSKKVPYQTRPGSPRRIIEQHFITFDLKCGNGRTFKSVFTYNYGDSRADYWVYALYLPEHPKPGKADVIFYAGDDTSDETIHLRLIGARLKAISHQRTHED